MSESQSQHDIQANRRTGEQANGIIVHITEQGTGPLVVLCHGWPELAYSWRHQIPALAQASYHVVAPDMRGYGGSSLPADTAAYAIVEFN